MPKQCYVFAILVFLAACAEKSPKTEIREEPKSEERSIGHAGGFKIQKEDSGITIITVNAPWPGAEQLFSYALVPEDLAPVITLDAGAYNAIISTPVKKLVVTSTTHIPALEALGVADRIIGFPDTRYISSPETRKRVENGDITELGSNESLNTELVLSLQPDLLVGFAVGNHNKAYDVVQKAGIPVVYNGDWTEESPLGKAEWIKFFAPFFGLEAKADSIFGQIEAEYRKAMDLAGGSNERPTILCGALYKDVWYLPGGKSWAAQFLKDANARYLWADTDQVGSLSLSLETMLQKGSSADYWIGPSQFTSYQEMLAANRHYEQFKAFREKKVYTFALTRGATGGFEYYELAPNRPDLVLKDLIHILHPGLLPDHEPYFFKPLE